MIPTQPTDLLNAKADSSDAACKHVPRIDRKRRRWLPRFRLLDLIWLSLIAAILMSWNRDRQQLLAEYEKLAKGRLQAGSSWSIKQIVGAPDTPSPGDQSTAWAPLTPDGSREWVIVEFPNSVQIKKIVVYETYNPGAIDRICAVDFKLGEFELWKGSDPTPTTAAMGLSSFPVKAGTSARRIKLYLNSPAVAGWNEIDAIALYGKDGSVQWASDAWASSAYGNNQELPKWFWP